MRRVLVRLARPCFVGLIVFGAILMFVGYLNQQDAANFYKVGFGRLGNDCGDELSVYFDVDDGKQLVCEPSGMTFGSPSGFSGFSEQQMDDVTSLATRLASDGGGLSGADKRQIQNQVDQIVATLAPSDREKTDPGDGTPQATLGGVMVAVGVLGYFASPRPRRRPIRRRYP